MSVWELLCCVEGYRQARGGDGADAPAPMSVERARELGIEGL